MDLWRSQRFLPESWLKLRVLANVWFSFCFALYFYYLALEISNGLKNSYLHSFLTLILFLIILFHRVISTRFLLLCILKDGFLSCRLLLEWLCNAPLLLYWVSCFCASCVDKYHSQNLPVGSNLFTDVVPTFLWKVLVQISQSWFLKARCNHPWLASSFWTFY